MIVYGNRIIKPPYIWEKICFSGYFTLCVAGTNREGRNLYPYNGLYGGRHVTVMA